jgi:hypothetical protein
MNHHRLTALASAATAAALLAGCGTTTTGVPQSGPQTGSTSTTATSTTTPTDKAIKPAPINPTPTPGAMPPNAQVLAPQNGYVFIATKSGQTRCQLSTDEVGCESAFTNPPQVNGEAASGVRVSSSGKLSWVVGNLGAIPTTTIDYQTYSAVGWVIVATVDGTRFTNAATGHGMVVSTAGVQAF